MCKILLTSTHINDQTLKCDVMVFFLYPQKTSPKVTGTFITWGDRMFRTFVSIERNRAVNAIL